MKLKLMAAAAVAALASAATGAQAYTPGVYVGADVGYHWPSDIRGTSSAQPLVNWQFRGEDDWTGFGRLGYGWASGLRFELEGGYRPSDVDRVFSKNAAATPLAPIVSSTIFMALRTTGG